MKRFLKYIGALIAAVVGLVSFASCSNSYNFYNDWTAAGATLSTDHIIEAVSLEDITAKEEAGETFVLFLGTSSSSSARTNITKFDAYTQELAVTKDTLTVYYFNTTDYYEKTSDRKQVKSVTGIAGQIANTSDNLIICIYKNGKLKVDSTDTDSEEMDNLFLNGSSVNYDAMFTYILQDFPASLK